MTFRFRLVLALIAALALIWLFFAAIERALALTQRYLALPVALQWLIGAMLVLFAIVGLTLLWWLVRPRRRRRAMKVTDRADVEQRLQRLRERNVDTTTLDTELTELDQRKHSGRVYVALFGEISTGKSTLIRAIAPHALTRSDVRGGTTRDVQHIDANLPDGRSLTLADVPGSREAGGEAHEHMARQESLRAHAVVYLCTGDLTRTQASEVRWLSDFGKPLLLALNKADQWSSDERASIVKRLQEQTRDVAATVVAISAGGNERFERPLPDGGSEQVERLRRPAIEPLLDALVRLTAAGASALEPSRERAVLAGLHESTGALESATRTADAEKVVRKYARRAVIGALAAVAPGSDLVIQGALAAAMTRELAMLYDIRVTDVQIEDFLQQARLTLRTGSSIVLAIAGNALKAFPGLGTLGGGILHAFAYALIFDSMGRALAASLAERKTLDQTDASDKLKTLLTEASSGRVRQLAALTAEAWRERSDPDGRPEQ
jgi:uncharacterized protein